MAINLSTGDIYITGSFISSCTDFFTCKYDYSILKISSAGKSSVIAGHGAGLADGSGDVAMFDGPAGIAIDGQGNIYVGDTGNNRIRKISKM